MEEFTFVRGSNPSVLWNPRKDAPLAEFNKEGVFKTTNEIVANVLRNYGYKEMKDFPDGPPDGGFKPLKQKDSKPVNLNPDGGPTREPDLEVNETSTSEEEKETVTRTRKRGS